MIQITGALIIAIGIAIGSVFGAILSMSLFPALIGISLFLYGLFFRYTLAAKGWEEVSGICIGYSVLFSFRREKHHPASFLLQTGSEILSIPNARRKDPVPVGTKVTVYVPKNPVIRKDLSGYRTYPAVFGYEVTGFQEAADKAN